MYRNLRAEIARRGLSTALMAEVLGCGVSTVCARLRGEQDWKLKECRALKELLQYEGTIEELFDDGDESM